MNFSGWRKSRHTILKSETLDEIDEIASGKSFKIRYLGCTNLDQTEDCNFNKTAEDILSTFPRKRLKILPALELFIDLKSLSVTDQQSEPLTLLEISLSDIRDILYRKKDKHYGNICIFVARHVPLSPNVKAHVLYCDTSNMAEKLFETFRGIFKVHNERSHERKIREEIPTDNIVSEDIEDTKYSVRDTSTSDVCDINENPCSKYTQLT